jgi:hypothetical protein
MSDQTHTPLSSVLVLNFQSKTFYTTTTTAPSGGALSFVKHTKVETKKSSSNSHELSIKKVESCQSTNTIPDHWWVCV